MSKSLAVPIRGEGNQIDSASVFGCRRGSAAQRVTAIALNTFRETVRDRLLYNLVLFAIILVICSIFVSELSLSEESKFIADLGLSAVLIFGGIISIFIGVGLVYKEIEKRTIYFLLSKPVHRHEFIVGKFLGLCLTLLINSAAMVLGTMAALIYANRGLSPLLGSIPPAAFLLYLELGLLVSISLLFSAFTTPTLAALFSFAAFVIGNFSPDLKLAASMAHSSLLRSILMAAYYVLPNLSNFSFIGEASHGEIVPWRIVLSAVVYTVIYVSILLSATIMVFRARSFK